MGTDDGENLAGTEAPYCSLISGVMPAMTVTETEAVVSPEETVKAPEVKEVQQTHVQAVLAAMLDPAVNEPPQV
eukprot:Skav214248  [mRNA]  locus=scaffold2045:335281:335939:- [translate_table: standard]